VHYILYQFFYTGRCDLSVFLTEGESMFNKLQRSAKILFLSSIVTVLATDIYAAAPVQAVADMQGCSDKRVKGSAKLKERFSEEGVKVVDVTLNMRGLSPGKHAVHIHEAGACEPCGAAGGHFDPGPDSNTSPDGNHPFHSGDLINIVVNAGGVGSLHTVTTRVTLSPGPLSLFDADGSAIIIHDSPDTYCPEGAEAGCAGGTRAACGILKLE
jgi:Cu-Zn family superoxide dismutase